MRDRRLLILSHVLPFPRSAGQHQRVYHTIVAARRHFHVTFATMAAPADAGDTERQLRAMCDDVLMLPSRCQRSSMSRVWHRGAGSVFAARSGLKRSNYEIGRVEFEPDRVARLLGSRSFDCALFEYWHAVASVPVFTARSVPCVLDMHDVLWQSYRRDLTTRSAWPEIWKRRAVSRYKTEEEHAWRQFDALVAINRDEEQYVQERVARGTRVFHAAMGTDLAEWPYSPDVALPARVAYYGGFGNVRNQEGAIRCASRIMPMIWRERPDAELWLVGSHPPAAIRDLAVDPRVHVTGFVENVQDILRTATLVLCPWTGTYGFRSRLVEVLALGVPLVVSPDAIAGMQLAAEHGVLLAADDAQFGAQVLRLLNDTGFAEAQGRRGRAHVERLFSIESTYGTWMSEMVDWLENRRRKSTIAAKDRAFA